MRTYAVTALVMSWFALLLAGCASSEGASWSSTGSEADARWRTRALYFTPSEAPSPMPQTAHADSPLSRRLELRGAH